MIRTERLDHGGPGFAGVAEIVLDRAEKRNALTPAMLDEMVVRAEALNADPSVRAIVLRGEGSVFCAGFDLSLCRDDPTPLAEMLRGLARAIRALRRGRVPVVAAAHGGAIAGGCALLGAADLVVGDRRGKYGYPVVSLGISPAVSAPTLRRAVGERAARARLLDPALIDGDEAKRIGLLDLCTEIPEDVVPRAQIEAGALGRKPPGALAATKRWLNEVEGTLGDAELDTALAASLAIVGSREERERLATLFGGV
ncbi:MAG TPA: enoyl-CoA hydratase [Phycisphaerales bacterium]|nr:enoyl-CoA hydratase [Phycisphaerales bacterium]